MAFDREALTRADREPAAFGASPGRRCVNLSSLPVLPVPGSSLSTVVSEEDLEAGGGPLALTLERPPDPGRARIHVEGTLSAKNVHVLVELLDRQLADGRRWVLVEAHLLSHLDAAALGRLRASHQQFVRAGGSLLIRGVRVEMFDRTGTAEPPLTTAFRPAATPRRRPRHVEARRRSDPR